MSPVIAFDVSVFVAVVPVLHLLVGVVVLVCVSVVQVPVQYCML